jgi:hypothetical protein
VDIRSKVEKARAKAPPKQATIYVAESFLDWQQVPPCRIMIDKRQMCPPAL